MFDIKKTLEKVVRGIIASGIAIGSTYLLQTFGVTFDADTQLKIVAVVLGVIAGLTNLLKHKFPKVFGWL